MVSRFIRPQEWQENTIGHQAEAILLRILARIGIQAHKASDFEDCRLTCDLWVCIEGKNFAIQLSVACEPSADKVYRTRQNGVIPIFLQLGTLQKADPACFDFDPKALNALMRDFTSQVKDFLATFKGSLLTPEQALERERKELRSRNREPVLSYR